MTNKRHRRLRATTGVQKQYEEEVLATTTAFSMTINLLKNMLGVTVLSLASGIAAYSHNRSAIVSASVLLGLLAAMSCYSFVLIARTCEMLGVKTFRGAWEKAIGERSAWILSLTTSLISGAGCLQYVMVLTEAISSLAMAAGLPLALSNRTSVLLFVVVFLLLPLSFLENCSQLKFTSALGLTGAAFYILAIVWRFWEGSYAPGGAWHLLTAPAMRPKFGGLSDSVFSSGGFVLVSMITCAYVCHYNAPKFYNELKDRTMPKFINVALAGFGSCCFVYVLGAVCSFLTFGGNSAGFIFTNYAQKDVLFVIARVVVSGVMLCTFPLMFVATRQGAMELLPSGKEVVVGSPRYKRRSLRVTVGLMAFFATLGLATDNISKIVAVPGALLGSSVAYIFPALIFLGATKPPGASVEQGAMRKFERMLNRALVVVGVVFASVGTYTCLRM